MNKYPAIYGGDSMFVIITYDVSVTSKGGQKRLRDVAKYCEKYWAKSAEFSF